MEIITSKSNQYVKLCRSLQEKKYRQKTNYCLLEGVKIIREAVKNNKKIFCIFTLEHEYERAKREFTDYKIIVVDGDILKYISSTITPQNYVGICEITKHSYEKPHSNYLFLDQIQDPSNLGAIIRTAVATNFTTIYLNDCVDEYNEKVIRASMGNLFKCKFIHISLDKLDDFRDTLYICDMNGKNIFTCTNFNSFVGLCISNEGHGVSDYVRQNIKNIISIPMLNDVESLNASVSASIVMYHVAVNQKEI